MVVYLLAFWTDAQYTLANSEDPDEMQHDATFHQDLHFLLRQKQSKGAKIKNRYNQVPHLTQDTNGKVTNSQQTPQTRAKRSALSQQVTTKHI